MIKDALIKLNPFEAGGGSRGPDREAAERALPRWALISLSLNVVHKRADGSKRLCPLFNVQEEL